MSVKKLKTGYLVDVYYRKEDGREARLSKCVKKYSEVAEARRELENRIKNYSVTEITFDKLIDEYVSWLYRNRRHTTAKGAEKKLRNHVLPYFKGKKVADLTYPMVIKWKAKIDETISMKDGEPIGLVYKRNLYTAFHGLMSFALKAYGISSNALQRAGNFISDPNAVPEEAKLHYWTPEQFSKFCMSMSDLIEEGEKKSGNAFDYMECQGIYVFFNILFYAGLRRGEANALQIRDFHDGENPYLSVTKSVSMKTIINGQYSLTPPKNKFSVRNVPIPKHLAELIRLHIESLKKENKTSFRENWYLCGGKDPIPDTTADLLKDRAEKKAGLPHIRVHDLRHSHSLMLINKGPDIQVISRLMGHGSP